jgi:hypothetical protein
MPGTIIYSDDLIKFKKELEEETGFACYEVQPGDQTTFFGTSAKFDDFKEAVENKFNTGTIAYLMDTSKKYMYSRYTNTWYELS